MEVKREKKSVYQHEQWYMLQSRMKLFLKSEQEQTITTVAPWTGLIKTDFLLTLVEQGWGDSKETWEETDLKQ